MKKIKLPKITNDLQKTITKHSPKIFTVLGIGGFITTAVLSGKATIKAVEVIEQRKELLQTDKLPPVEIVKATYKCYIPAIATGMLSTACILGANSVQSKRTAAIATAYQIAQTGIREYKDAVIETIGEEKEKEIKEKAISKHVNEQSSVNKQTVIVDSHDVLCYDEFTGRLFSSNKNAIERAKNEINARIYHDNYATLNEFYVEIGLDPVEVGNLLGWNVDDRSIDIEYGSFITQDGKPCLTIGFDKPPRYGCDRFD